MTVITIVRVLQQFDKYNKLNPIEMKIDRNKIVGDLAKYQEFKYHFIIDGHLFNSAISNNTNTIFITANGLNDGKDGLINGKIHKTLGIINSTEIKDWNLVKGKSK